jgi:hypothetical protein
MRRRVFIGWSVALGIVWLSANWPRSSSIASFFQSAGFPLVFLFWAGGRLESFSPGALVIDGALGIVFVFGLAWLCACSRSKNAERGAPADSAREEKGTG